MSVVKNEEHEADSIDSGCVPDSLVGAAIINWQDVNMKLVDEYNFALGLLQHCPRTAAENSNKEKRYHEITVAATNVIDQRKIQPIDTKNAPTGHAGVFQLQREISDKIGKLRKGKIGKLSPTEAKHQVTKLKKQLAVIENRRKKKIKKLERFNRIGDPKQPREAYPGIPAKAAVGKQIYNQCGKLVFSKFDFSSVTSSDKWEENKKKLDLNNQLQNVLKEKEKVKRLEKQGNSSQAVNYLEDKAWKNAFKKADGVKVKDDQFKLVKSIKKQKLQKARSGKKWDEKEKLVKKFRDIRQEKKQSNIIKRKKMRVERKGKKGKKPKGKSGGGPKKKSKVPGF